MSDKPTQATETAAAEPATAVPPVEAAPAPEAAAAVPPVEAAVAPPPPPYESPLDAARSADSDVLDAHPEILVAGAFLGGLVLAQVLRKLGPS